MTISFNFNVGNIIGHFSALLICFVDYCFYHVSCAHADLIPTLPWLLHGFLNSRTALPLAHCILHRH